MPNDNDFAIIVGINDYKELPPLKGPVSDALAFRDWVRSADGGDIPEQNCKFIDNTDSSVPTQDLIDAKLDEIIAGGGPYRRLYFFFAGHGIGLDWSSNGLCLPGWTSRFRNKSLSSKAYLDYTVGTSFFQEVYFFLDCCRDRLINAIALPPTLGLARPRGQGVKSLVLYASDFENAAGEALDQDTSSTVRGYFSQALVDGLKGAAADQNGNITANGLVNFTQRKTAELAMADQQSQTVTPQFYGPGITMDELIIREGVAPPVTAVTVTFPIGGRIQLAGPDLQPIFTQTFAPGQQDGPRNLGKGLYELSDQDSGRSLIIKIDGTKKEASYEF
ncbi:MAG: caspase family protein [Bacteroidota bacterium]